jgi:hypothetical protein
VYMFMIIHRVTYALVVDMSIQVVFVFTQLWFKKNNYKAALENFETQNIGKDETIKNPAILSFLSKIWKTHFWYFRQNWYISVPIMDILSNSHIHVSSSFDRNEEYIFLDMTQSIITWYGIRHSDIRISLCDMIVQLCTAFLCNITPT